MSLHRYWILIAMLMLASFAWAGPLADEFNLRIRATAGPDEARAIVAEYKESMTELSDFRSLQNYWMEIDPAECQAFFFARHQQRPNDPEAHYLWTRTMSSDTEQMAQARLMISKYPDFYWAYRSLSGAYTNSYFVSGIDEAIKDSLGVNLDADMQLVQQGLDKYPQDDYLLVCLLSYYLERADYPQAEAYALRIQDPAAIRANFAKIEKLVTQSGRMRAFETKFPLLISNMIQLQELPAADSLQMYQFYYLTMLNESQSWQALDTYLESHPELSENPRFAELFIQINIARENYEKAMELIAERLKSGDLRLKDLQEAGGYASLKELEGWQELINLAQLMHEERLPQIRENAISNPLNKPAPSWSFPDLDGNTHSLADYRGKIVIMCFWAFWCEPCKANISLIKSWAQSMPEDVELVFINVWERDIPAARNYARHAEDHMTFVEGDREIPSQYGFSGIPYICVVDAAGNLAWDLVGYSEDLEDILDIWVNELSKSGDR